MKKNMKKAFTLIETLVAITILLLAIGGPMYAVSQSLSSAIYARDQITAFYLAQDAVEYIRNIRDNNALAGSQDWLAGFTGYYSDPGGSDLPFTIDTTQSFGSGALRHCSGTCPALQYDSASGQYGYSFDIPSAFTRTITMKKVDLATQDHEVQIAVDISWKPNIAAAKRDFSIVETLTNWVR